MDIEDLIKRYPEGTQHKPSHAECVKFGSFLGSSNLTKLKHKMGKLPPFLVSSLLHSDEATLPIATSNIKASVPYIQEQLQELVIQQLVTIQSSMKEDLEKLGKPAKALQIWRTIVYVLGPVLHKNRTAVNTLLIILEKAFKSSIPGVQKNAFFSWKELIDNFASNPEVISHAKRLKLVLQPMISNKSKLEEVQLARADTWWHIAVQLKDKLNPEFEKVCIPLLRFVFQMPADSGRLSNSSQEESRAMLLKGTEILHRILEIPGQNLPAALSSPKKTPPVQTAPLTVPVSHLAIAKNAPLILDLLRKSLKFLLVSHPGSPLSQSLVQMLLFRMNMLSKENGKDEVQAVALFIQFTHFCIKENLLSNGLKLIDSVTRLLSSKVLTSHCYHLATNSTEVMNGVPALGFLDILLSDAVFFKDNSSEKFVTVFNRLVNAGVEETNFYLSFAQTILDKLVVLATKEKSESLEIIVTLWTHTTNSLWRKIQKTQEVNQGDSLEHNFSCIISALTLPLKLHLKSSKSLQSKEMEKCWTNLCKAFLKCAAVVPNTEANVACEELFSEMLSLVQQESHLSSKVLGWLNFVIGITLNCIDFQSVNTMQNTASLLESPENWRKRQQRPLGNISSIITILRETLSSVYQLLKLKDGVAGETYVTSCLLHTKTIFNSVTLSSVLVSLVTTLSPGLVCFYQKPTDTKKLSTYYNKLEQTWQSIVSAFLLYYKGPHSQDTFDALRPLLEPTLLHPQKAIQERARSLWLTAFSDTYSTLHFPDSFKSVLKEVRPALIPGSQISSIDSITSLEPSLEVAETPKTRRKLIATEVQEPLKKDSFITPKSTKKSKKDKQNNLENFTTEDDQDFVIIPPTNTATKRVLTEHQKEVLKQKSPIPAMYSDLTQETQDTQSENSSTLLSTSIQQPSKSTSEPQEPVNHEESSVIAEEPVIDLESSNNSTVINSIPCTTDTEVAPLETVPEDIDEVQTELQNRSPDNSDDSQLSGTDSPIVLPIGISSKDVKMPRVVKRDVKLKEAFPEVKIQRLAYKDSQPLIMIDLSPSKTNESQNVDTLDSELVCQTPTRRSTRKTTRKSGLEVETEDMSNASSKQKNKIQKPLLDSGDLLVCDKPSDSESGSSRRRRGKEPVVDSTKVTSEKKIKTGKRKIQISDDDGCKKKGKIGHDGSVESDEDLPDVMILSSHSSSQNLLNEIGAKSESSSIEVIGVVDTGKQVETIEIEESQNVEEVDQTVEEDTENTTNVNMEDVGCLEAQEVMPDDFLNSEPVSEEIYEEAHLESAEDKEEEPNIDENREELITENGPAEQNIPSDLCEQEQVEGLGPDDNNTDTIPETQVELLQVITSEGDKNSAQHLSKSDKQHETSQNITDFSTEELQVIETSSTIRKRKAASPVRSPSSRTTLTVGVGSKWKSKDSGGKKSKRILSKNSQSKGNLALLSEEEGINNQTDSKFQKDEKENTSIISNDCTTADESVVSVAPEKVKPSPVSQSKRKSLRGASSPLSRSQRMLEAAIKNRTCESDPPSPKTGHDNLLQSPPQSKSGYVYSPFASPSSGILKGETQISEKPCSPQNGQKRKVSFADPPVQGGNEKLNSAFSPDEQEFADGITEENESVEENSALFENELRESEDLPEDSEAPVYPDLIGCSDSARAIFSQLTSSLWSRGLDKLLRSKGLNTIGDLSALTYPEVLGLPIVAPKVKTLKAALMKYHQNQSKTSSPGHAKLHSPPLVTENCPDEYSEEKRQPGDAKTDMDIEASGDARVDIENEDYAQDLNDIPTMGSQDLLLTQVPSRGLCASQDEEEAEMENAYHSPPLPSMETALNDEELLESSMLGTDSDFSLFVRPEEHHSKEFGSENQQTLNTSKGEVAALSDQSENVVPLGQKDIEDFGNCTDEQIVTFLNHMPSQRLLGIINQVLKSRLV